MKKSRQIRHTIFIYCEGKTDHLFVRYLKKQYLVRGTKQITLKKGTGGKLSTFILETVKIAQVREYNEKYIVLDSDGKKEEELGKELKEAQNKIKRDNINKDDINIQLIWQKPCLEGVFLRILKSDKFIKEKSESCKSIFNKEYIQDKTPLTETLLEKLFTKDFLSAKRQEVQELDQLIQLMEKRKEEENE